MDRMERLESFILFLNLRVEVHSLARRVGNKDLKVCLALRRTEVRFYAIWCQRTIFIRMTNLGEPSQYEHTKDCFDLHYTIIVVLFNIPERFSCCVAIHIINL